MTRSPQRALAWIDEQHPLPPPESALRSPNGLLAASADLTPQRLHEAYRKGIFPWFSDGQPVLWWSPDPRMVLYLDEFKTSRSLTKTLRRLRRESRWRVTFDLAFDAVIRSCAEPREDQDGTWITDKVIAAYGALHHRGCAHSVELWDGEGPQASLLAGLYGVSIGRMFYGESMFTRVSDGSKIALASLVFALRDAGYRVIDCQQNTRHLSSLGGREISREAFLTHVAELTVLPGADWGTFLPELPEV